MVKVIDDTTEFPSIHYTFVSLRLLSNFGYFRHSRDLAAILRVCGALLQVGKRQDESGAGRDSVCMLDGALDPRVPPALPYASLSDSAGAGSPGSNSPALQLLPTCYAAATGGPLPFSATFAKLSVPSTTPSSQPCTAFVSAIDRSPGRTKARPQARPARRGPCCHAWGGSDPARRSPCPASPCATARSCSLRRCSSAMQPSRPWPRRSLPACGPRGRCSWRPGP